MQRSLAETALDGWLLCEFRGTNPIAAGLPATSRMSAGRGLGVIPRVDVRGARTLNNEQGPWRNWPAEWNRER
jgi:hypothetical protein